MTTGQLRYRLARRLVGPFVTLPEREGVWVVVKSADGSTTATYEADKFRIKTGITPHRDLSKTFGGDNATFERYGFLTRWGRFVGTVKYR